jgi:PIN domain nuclease of toxin-antitoxin system
MNYVLDTHAWFWALEMPEKIPARTRAALGKAADLPFGLSAISLWEMAKLVEKGRIVLTIPLEEWMARALRPEFIRILPITPDVAIGSTRLPGSFHNDPADQIIVATVRLQAATLVTADEAIQHYDAVRTLWS